MTDTSNTPADANKAPAAQGASAADLDPASTGGGNPAPAAPSNEPPKPEGDDANTGDDPKPNTGEGEGEGDPDGNKPDDTPDGDEGPKEVWPDTGNTAADSAINLMKDAGMTLDEAKAMLFEGIQNNDPSQLDEAALVEKVGQDKANLILIGVKSLIAENTATTNKILDIVHGVVGGEENWATVADWAKKNVPESDLAEYREMIDNGGKQAQFATSELLSLYNGDEKNTTLGKSNTLEGDAAANPSIKPLSRAEYTAAISEAHRDGTYEAVRGKLWQARELGKSQGK